MTSAGRLILVGLLITMGFVPSADAETLDKPKLVIVAGKPSHPAGMHEFNAGVQLLSNCLKDRSDIDVHFVLNGWPKDEGIFKDAAAVVFYMDGGGRHEVVQEGKRRLEMVDGWSEKGIGLGFMHYGVEVLADQAGAQFKKWIGGHYDHMFSCNPIWEPRFETFLKHPITNGVKPFSANDEWYFNMRFVDGVSADGPSETEELKFWPILVASPSVDVRDGPYVYPKGPYPHIEASKGRAEAMMWATERKNGARGYGFTGGHFHKNWGDENFRKVVLNAMLWIAKAEVPENGVESKVTEEQLKANLDPKRR